MKIGVLSNGVTNLAASQARGDLGPVTVLPGQAGSGDEGTAMLEIIHDLAPGAQLFFAAGLNGITSFADNIRALRAAGCDIIVDDVIYFVETPFQDGQAPEVISTTNGGIVIQAVKDVTASGALYFSSAGNSGNFDAGTAGVWEGDFVDGGPTAAPFATGYRVHDFGGQNFNTLTVANPNAPLTLYWSDPLGGSSNDYDLFRLTSAGNAIAASSTNIQNGTQDPIEQISQNVFNPHIVIVKKDAAQPRFLHLNANRGRMTLVTAGTTHGHAAVTGTGAYGVAATPAAGPFPQPFGAGDVVETFSSDGPRHIFYRANGAAITEGEPGKRPSALVKRSLTARPFPVFATATFIAKFLTRRLPRTGHSRTLPAPAPVPCRRYPIRAYNSELRRSQFRRGHPHGAGSRGRDGGEGHGVPRRRKRSRVRQSGKRQRRARSRRRRAADRHAEKLRRRSSDGRLSGADVVDPRHYDRAAERRDVSRSRAVRLGAEHRSAAVHGGNRFWLSGRCHVLAQSRLCGRQQSGADLRGADWRRGLFDHESARRDDATRIAGRDNRVGTASRPSLPRHRRQCVWRAEGDRLAKSAIRRDSSSVRVVPDCDVCEQQSVLRDGDVARRSGARPFCV